MAINEDCQHFILQTTSTKERIERCRLGANEEIPFACPQNCPFYEPRKPISYL